MAAPPRIVLFGELLMRLNTEGFERFVQADRLRVRYTGAEANAGIALASWGWNAAVVSRVPAHELGQACVNFLRAHGLDTARIQRGGDRLGLLFVETGASQRSSQVIYDRSASAFTEFDDAAIDWDEVFDGCRWFHFSGTAPAVAPHLAPIIERATAAARRQGATVSCDVNHRRKLWGTADAGAVMTRLMTNVEVLFCNEEDAAAVWGIRARESEIVAGRLSPAGYEAVAGELARRFGCSHVGITLRESFSASRNGWSALLAGRTGSHFSRKYDIDIVDRIGAGDAFAAGVIHGLAQEWDPQRTVEFAAAASCLKHSIPGDFNVVSLAEVESLARGNGSGRIQR